MQQGIPAAQIVVSEQQLNDDRPIEINIVTIVKNDVSIKRMINTFQHLANRFFILDTGSTDETLTLIQDTIFNEKLPIVLFERPFENFVHSRNFILNKAYMYLRNHQTNKQVIVIVDSDEFLNIDNNLELWKDKLKTIQSNQVFQVEIIDNENHYSVNRI